MIYDKETSKIYPDLKPTARQEPQAQCLKKLTETEAYSLDEIEKIGKKRLAKKKNETIQYHHKYRGYRSNNINSYYWKGFYCCVCKWC